MALKFNCQNCRADIIVKFLKLGEIAKCKVCDAENIVPETVSETSETPNYSRCGITREKKAFQEIDLESENSIEAITEEKKRPTGISILAVLHIGGYPWIIEQVQGAA